MVFNYFDHSVAKNAAALAYYLLFALFPLMIFFSNLLGTLELNVFAITKALDRVLPDAVVDIAESYLEYVSLNSSRVLMWFSLVFSVWFPMRAVKGLMDDVRRAYELPAPKKPIRYIIKQLLFTVVFLVVIVLTLFLATVGERLLVYLDKVLPESIFGISDYFINLWQYLRFGVIAFLMLFATGILYLASFDEKRPVKTVIPGICTALILWVVLSIGFSFYVENFANYSLIYGTLGAIIILLIWLYMTAVILIMGAELNSAIDKFKNSRER
ncbi:MAG: YihY/virulence factor BrkB family protein [Clostridia bacterium]|nr:YihY/virulence factor BrkB family protein [Clostridia bacterium]